MGRPWRSRLVILATLGLLFSPPQVEAQEPPDIQVLDPEYRQAQAAYEEAFSALEAMESRFTQAMEDWESARANNDEPAAEAAFSLQRQLSGQLGLQRIRVSEKADELRQARTRLLEATRRWLDDLLGQMEASQDEAQRAALRAILADVDNRRFELLSEEEPETTLEPRGLPIIGPRDSPRDILRKASAMELRADRHQAHLERVGIRLEAFRQDLQRTRRVSDFLSDMERFGDTRVPVGRPGSQTNTPPNPEQLPPGADSLAVETQPLTLEEWIESLETLQAELEQRIEIIRDRVAFFRARARGGERI